MMDITHNERREDNKSQIFRDSVSQNSQVPHHLNPCLFSDGGQLLSVSERGKPKVSAGKVFHSVNGWWGGGDYFWLRLKCQISYTYLP